MVRSEVAGVGCAWARLMGSLSEGFTIVRFLSTVPAGRAESD
jgi:hypothetical protein